MSVLKCRQVSVMSYFLGKKIDTNEEGYKGKPPPFIKTNPESLMAGLGKEGPAYQVAQIFPSVVLFF